MSVSIVLRIPDTNEDLLGNKIIFEFKIIKLLIIKGFSKFELSLPFLYSITKVFSPLFKNSFILFLSTS